MLHFQLRKYFILYGQKIILQKIFKRIFKASDNDIYKQFIKAQ